MNLEVLVPLAWTCWVILLGTVLVGTVMMARDTQCAPEVGRGCGVLVFALMFFPLMGAGWLLYYFTRNHSRGGVLAMAILLGFVVVMLIAQPAVRAYRRWSFEREHARVGTFEDPALIPLAEAIRAGDCATLTRCLGGGPVPPGRDRAGHDLLGYSLVAFRDRRGSLDCVRALLEAGSDPDATRTPDGVTPLHFTIVDTTPGGREASLLLLKHGADPNAVDPITGDTPIRESGDSPDLVRALIEAGAEMDRIQSNGVTALVEFVARRQWESARYLVERGARLDVVNANGLSLGYYLEDWRDSVFGEHPEGWDRLRAAIAARGRAGHGLRNDMKLPEDVLAGIAELPEALRAVVEAELAAGNEVAEVLHGHPVPPAGVGIRLVRPLSVPLTSATTGVRPCQFPAWDGSSGYSDEPKHSFVLGPPGAPPDPPDMGEIRDAANQTSHPAADAASDSSLDRFKRSLQIDREKWREGVGYDLDAIREASPEERASIEALLLQRGVRDWRDVEALAILNSPRAREALRSAMASRDHEVALAVARHAPDLLDEEARAALIVHALERATFFGGLSQALNQAEECHPPPVIEALLHGVVRRDGEVAAHFAAMLMFLHGRAETAFDMDQRPFFLTFDTQDPTARAAAFRELCRKIGVEAQLYLGSG